MKTKHTEISALLATSVLLCVIVALPCNAADKSEGNAPPPDEPNVPHKELAPPEKGIEHPIDWGGKTGWHKGKPGREFRPGPNMPFAGPLGPNEPPREQIREAFRERLQERVTELLEWLKKNYPEEAQKLTDLKDKNPDLYRRQVALSFRKYGRIMEASLENPELADVFKKDMELRKQQHELLEKIKATANNDEKTKLTAELEQVISDRFDVIVKRKQAEYEQLLKRLENLKEEVNTSKAEIEKWKQTKDEKVKERLNELMSKTDRFEWDR